MIKRKQTRLSPRPQRLLKDNEVSERPQRRRKEETHTEAQQQHPEHRKRFLSPSDAAVRHRPRSPAHNTSGFRCLRPLVCLMARPEWIRTRDSRLEDSLEREGVEEAFEGVISTRCDPGEEWREWHRGTAGPARRVTLITYSSRCELECRGSLLLFLEVSTARRRCPSPGVCWS